MGLLDTLKGANDKMQMIRQAQQLQKQLAQERFEVAGTTNSGEEFVLILTGEQKVVEVRVKGQRDQNIEKVIGDAIYKSQMAAASKMAGLTGGLGGLLGGN